MKHVLVLVSLILITPISAIVQGEEKPATQPRMVSVGDRRIAVYCDGEAGRAPTVILIAGGGRTAADWAKVQPGVASFARVCSYDPVNLGPSDKKIDKSLPWAEELVDDLHAWLKASGEKVPFILVAHSISGIHARRFVTKYPDETAGLVFVDSSHEEQALRIQEFNPNGPEPDVLARMGWYVKPGQRLDWKTELPLIVLARGKPLPKDSDPNLTEEQLAAWDRIWRGFQEDLAKRSTRGELRVAEQSGHLIQLDQPEIVIQAIRDVSKPR